MPENQFNVFYAEYTPNIIKSSRVVLAFVGKIMTKGIQKLCVNFRITEQIIFIHTIMKRQGLPKTLSYRANEA